MQFWGEETERSFPAPDLESGGTLDSGKLAAPSGLRALTQRHFLQLRAPQSAQAPIAVSAVTAWN